MEVLIYQIFVAVLILIAGAFGKKARNVVTLLMCLFTVVEVFTFKLAILQFITIFFSYVISIGYEEKKAEEKKLKKKEEFNYYVIGKRKEEKTENRFSSFFILFIIMSSLFYTFYVFQKKAELKKESVEIKKDTVVNKKGGRLFEQTYKKEDENVIVENEDFSTKDSINKDNYLIDNYPNGNSKYYDAVHLRTTSVYTRYKELDDSWGNWSEKITLKTTIIIYIKRNKISILSDVTYRYTDYDIVGINSVGKNVDGNDWEFDCTDEDGISCRIIHSISNNKDLMSQLRIEYSDEKKIYNVNREN